MEMVGQNDPVAVFTQYVKLVNAGDIDGVMELFDDGVVTSELVAGMYPGGRHVDALRRYIHETIIEAHGVLTTVRVATSGDWVYGVLEVRSDMVKNVGVERLVGIDELEVKGNRITSFRFLPNVLDAQTQKFFQPILGAQGGSGGQ